jgi:ABC-2 type transport system ATP-binding protein
MSAKKAIITVEDLVKNYGETKAVRGISFQVYEKEIFSLLGPNGAGKTTTLEIIETLLPKTSGKVTVDGLDLDRDPVKIKSIIGVQLQSAGFHQYLKLKEIINLYAALYDVKVDPEVILKKVDLLEKASSYVRNLSGGQKQRFSIATTVVHSPKVVFLDEPSTGLDPQARRNLWGLIREIRDQGTTVVLTTHFMDEAETLSDRVAIIDMGKILKIDTPDKLIDELLADGFTRPKEKKLANLEDVFLRLTGKQLETENEKE